ncbi:type 4b pilus protein PilO2 [Novosphingobium terrae]|uniref:type 4b pilus protein PilO2 n=1 Tax=Novosphingobium terrae TaxID=2726189 RepID=UPI001981516A|nr:type 4b pilus protein PilO2 [Novosphingobium terrae]
MSSFVRLPNGKQALVGLDWDTNSQGYGSTEARMRAKGAKASGFILRGGDNENLGLVTDNTVPSDGCISFAAVMADDLGADWCGVFQLDGQFVFVAVAHGCVLADGDRIYPHEASAKARLEQESRIFDKVYCPLSWGRVNSLDSDAAFKGAAWSTGAPIVVVRQAKKVNRQQVLIGAIALAVLFSGYQGWRIYQERKEAEELARRAPPPPPVDPWVNRASTMQAVDACLAAREVLSSTSHQGWDLKALSCEFNGTAARVVGTLSPYTANVIQPVLPPQFAAKLAADGTVMEATAQLKLAAVNRRGERPSAAAILEARNILLGQPKPATWRQNGRVATFDLSTSAPVQMIGASLQNIPTISIGKIELTGENWRVQGDIYN